MPRFDVAGFGSRLRIKESQKGVEGQSEILWVGIGTSDVRFQLKQNFI